ncbi:adenosylcobinamide amidohydrolase [Pseudooceanicola algae]|uniref:Uncharacterized protein n=1 Tax=Pseudooceanicola algae TaxID=1537215 RepID=A0A418SIQ0_9RHOB|nr:adenosylcobinamide amidohydrolase [Pseudooceanicola algae]QPM91203.1 hypothetical protein PSAL_024530 [Pseudooceanicola algae]
MTLTQRGPWLDFDLGAPMQVLSWAPHRPGLVSAARILWREVRNADLGPERDALAWLDGELRNRRAEDAVCFLTSRDLAAAEHAMVEVDGIRADAVATVGLSNAESIGRRLGVPPSGPALRTGWGTVNIALRLNCGLRPEALIELLSLVAEARTLAITEAGLHLSTGLATGTGTDCIAVAAPAGAGRFAGLHTAIGEAAGAAVLSAMRAGVAGWRPITTEAGLPDGTP